MAVTDLNTNEWLNADGLLVKFGADLSRPSSTGEFSTLMAGEHVIETSIDLVALSAISTFGSDIDVILDDNVTLPEGALIEKVVTIATEAVTGASATLDIGLYNLDRTNVYDQDGILAAADGWTGQGMGHMIEYSDGSTEVGSAVGTVLTAPVLLSAQVDGAAFTAGVLKVRIYFSIPLATELS